MAQNIYNFSELSHQEAKYAFKLTKVKSLAALTNWLAQTTHHTIDDFEEKLLNIVQNELIDSDNGWNEQELLMQFIAPILTIINFNRISQQVSTFSERWLKAKINNHTFQGKVDWMVASGHYDPIQPFFFLHEYKRGKEASGDPVGQLLSTMYVAQTINRQPVKPTLFNPTPTIHDNWPIFGCYVMGKYWHFVVLKDQEYIISPSYDATKTNELYDIVKLLKAQKQMISAYVESLENSLI